MGAPLSFAQERLWLSEQMQPGTGMNNVPLAWRITGCLDASALVRALDLLVERHEALRTGYLADAQTVRQVISVATPMPYAFADLRRSNDPLYEVNDALRREAAEPFDLRAGSVCRARLLQIADDQYVLALSQHHIATDGWSLKILWRELWSAYDAFRSGKRPNLPIVPSQYVEHAIAERSPVDAAEIDEHVEYWRRRLDSAPPIVTVPTDHPRGDRPTFGGSEILFSIPHDVLTQLSSACRIQGGSLFAGLVTALIVLVSRYSGQRDVCIGYPTANRANERTEGAVGFFVNSLPLRVKCYDDDTFEVIFARALAGLLDADEHKQLPFERIVQEVNPQRGYGFTPLFQVMLALDNTTSSAIGTEPDDLMIERLRVPRAYARSDLTFALTDRGGHLEGVLEYRTELYERDTVEQLSRHYVQLLRCLIAQPKALAFRVNFLTSGEKAALVSWGRGARCNRIGNALVQEMFEEQVALQPAAIAVESNEEKLTYERLNIAANKLANYLIGLGVGEEVRVGLCVASSVSMVVAMLAILKAGGVYVPIDPRYPRTRIEDMLSDPGVSFVLGSAAPFEKIQRSGATWLCLDSALLHSAGSSHLNPSVCRHALGAAYCIYTSGSSGKPKGVDIPNHALALSTKARIAAYPRSRSYLLLSSISFDSSVAAFFGALCSGGRLILPPADTAGDPRAIVDTIIGSGADTVLAVPTLWRQIVDETLARGTLLPLVAAISGGEALYGSDVERVAAACLPATTVVNEYGPTEGTVWATCLVCDRRSAVGVLPIGRPISSVRLYVLDEWLEPVPRGIGGEIYVGGSNLARGYVGQPALSAAAFVPDPYGEPGSRMYRTGDWGRWNSAGELEFLGRRDLQVKVNGLRIELLEIEDALRSYAGVKDAVVGKIVDRNGDDTLVAYAVPTEGVALVEADLLAELRSVLPMHMVPSSVMILPTLPTGPSGKVDRLALPTPARRQRSSELEYEARTATQLALCDIWKEVLHIASIGLREDFFSLGGHSLAAVRVSGLAARRGLRLPVAEIFRQPTIQQLAAYLDASESGHVVPAGRAASEQFRATRRVRDALDWELAQQQSGRRRPWILPLVLELSRALEESAIRKLVSELVLRHRVLAARLAQRDGEVEFVLSHPIVLQVEYMDGDPSGRVAEIVDEALTTSRELMGGPLSHFYYHIGSTRAYLTVVVEHIVSDLQSMDSIRSFLVNALDTGHSTPCPTRDFLDYCREEACEGSRFTGGLLRLLGEGRRRSDWWRPPLPQPPYTLGESISHVIPGGVVTDLAKVSQQARTTPFSLALTIYCRVVRCALGLDSLEVETFVDGRRPGTEGMVGLFMNAVVLRLDASALETLPSACRRVTEVFFESLDSASFGFTEIRRAADPGASHADFLWPLLFTYQRSEVRAKQIVTSRRAVDVTSAFVRQEHLTLGNALAVTLHDEGDGWRANWSFDTRLAETLDCQALVRQWYESLVDAPGQLAAYLGSISPGKEPGLVQV